MAIAGRSYPSVPVIVRGTLQDPPVLTTAPPVVVAAPPDRRWFASTAGTLTIARNTLQDPPVLTTAAPVVVAAVPDRRWFTGSAYITANPQAPAVVPATATPPPVVVSAPRPWPQTMQPQIVRSTLQDPPVLTTAAPVVVAAAADRRWFAAVPPAVLGAGAAGAAPVVPVFPDPRAQLDLRLELNAGGTWTDVTADCDHGPWTIGRGHPDESATVSPSTFAASLTNAAARYSPDNPMSDLWPWCVQNMPVRVSIPANANYLRLEPAAGDTALAYVADTAALHLTGSIEVRWAGRLTDWQGGVLGARVNGATPAWYWVLNGDGTMTFSWWDSGGTQWTASSDAPLSFVGSPFAVKVTLNAAAGTVTFYTATSIDGTYSQVGDAVVTGAASLRAGVAALETGTTLSSSFALGQLCGALSEVRLYSGIGGTLVADGQFAAQSAGATSWTGTDGLSWLLSGDAEISGRRYRGHFEASEWPQEEPEYNADIDNDTSVETDALVPLVGGGLLRRYGQRAPQFFSSTLRRALLTATGANAPVALWPCEDGSGTSLVSAIAGVSPITFSSGTPELAFAAPLGAATLPLPQPNGPVWHGVVPSYTSLGSIVGRLVSNTGALVGFTSAPLFMLKTTGFWASVYVIVQSDGSIFAQGYDSTGTLQGSTGVLAAGAWWLSLEVQPAGGGQSFITLLGLQPGDTSVQSAGVSISRTGSVGVVTDVYVNPSGAFTGWSAGTVIGMIGIYQQSENMLDYAAALSAYPGEPAGTRFARLCSENGIACRIRGNAADTTAMGAQAVDTLPNLLQKCADTDQGVWYEPRQVLGWGYATRKALYNQPATATVSYLSDHLSMWSTPPTRDDQVVVNDVTITNDSGSSARQYAAPGQPITGGRMSTVNPASGGIGSYAQSYPVSAASEAELPDLAAWKLHVGTADQARLPGIFIDLASQDATGIYDQVLDLDLGGRLVIGNPPRRLGFEPVTQLAQQLTETLWYDTLTIGVAGVPELPYEVAACGIGMHLAPPGGALSTGVTSTATSWSVAASATDPAQLWSVSAADYPQDWVVDGERVTVTAMTGATSPQTATVTRSVNGVVKAHLAGAAISNWPAPVLGL